MYIRKLTLAFCLAALSTGTAFAGAHTITYARKTAALGVVIALADQDFVLVRIPFRLFTGEKYYIILPTPLSEAGFGAVSVQTTHDTGTFTPNGTIDTLPARITVTDYRVYGFAGQPGVDSTFTAYAGVTVAMTIKIGTTLVTLGQQVSKPPAPNYETFADIGAAYNAQPFAQWAVYSDPVQQVQAANDLIDYIRIVPIQ